jgi:hypothetical protein
MMEIRTPEGIILGHGSVDGDAISISAISIDVLISYYKAIDAVESILSRLSQDHKFDFNKPMSAQVNIVLKEATSLVEVAVDKEGKINIKYKGKAVATYTDVEVRVAVTHYMRTQYIRDVFK